MDKRKQSAGTIRLVALLAAIMGASCLCHLHSQVKKESEVFLKTEDGRAWMEIVRDSEDLYLIGHVRNTVEAIADTLLISHELLGVYPNGLYTLDGTDGDTRYLFIFSEGRIFYYDKAVVFVAGKDGSARRGLFRVNDVGMDEVGVMWWDARVDACEGYPPDLKGYPDCDRDGIRFDASSKRLYVPIMDYHGDDSEFSGCPIYTGRFNVLEFDGKEFVYIGDD